MALWLIIDETDPSHSKVLCPITLRIAHLRIAPWWAILRWAILSTSFIRIAHPNHYVFFRLIWPLGECWGPRLCMPSKYYDVIIIFLRNITIVIFFYWYWYLMFFMSILCMDLRQIPPLFQQKCWWGERKRGIDGIFVIMSFCDHIVS